MPKTNTDADAATIERIRADLFACQRVDAQFTELDRTENLAPEAVTPPEGVPFASFLVAKHCDGARLLVLLAGSDAGIATLKRIAEQASALELVRSVARHLPDWSVSKTAGAPWWLAVFVALQTGVLPHTGQQGRRLGQPGKWINLRYAAQVCIAACDWLLQTAATPGTKPAGAATHSPDFTSVDWFGTRYTFAKGNQAESVRVLWDAWESGGHSLSQETIGDRIGSAASRFVLAKVFRRRADGGYEQHPAWGTMIRPDSKGSYRLTPPESA